MNRPEAYPFATSSFYLPAPLRWTAWIDKPSFHAAAALVGHSLVLLAFLLLALQAGLSPMEALTVSVVALYLGPKVSPPVVQPNPFTISGFYDFRTVALAGMLAGLTFWSRGQPLAAGLALALVGAVHIKLGVRLFLFLGSWLALWQAAFHRLGRGSRVSLRPIVQGALPFAAGLVLAVVPIFHSLHAFEHLRPAPAGTWLSPLGWLVKNEPDDWLASFITARDSAGFLALTLLGGLSWVFLLRRTKSAQVAGWAGVALSGLSASVVFWAAGLLFERWLWPILPAHLVHQVALTKFWDFFWVLTALSWTGLALLALDFWKSAGGAERWPLAATLTGLVLLTGLRARRHGGVVTDGTLARDGIAYEAQYLEVCSPESARRYEGARRNAYAALETGGLPRALDLLDAVYRRAAGLGQDGGVWSDPQAWNIQGLALIRSGRVPAGLSSLDQAGRLASGSVLWSCRDGQGSRKIALRLPLDEYISACRWISGNLPPQAAVIQPPYLPAFNMLSGRLGFWDYKLDNHMMYMIPGYYGHSLDRLHRVAGPYAIEKTPGVGSGDVGPEGREFFLGLQAEDWRRLRKDYPAYGYLLTERGHCPGKAALFKNASFSVCPLPEPAPAVLASAR